MDKSYHIPERLATTIGGVLRQRSYSRLIPVFWILLFSFQVLTAPEDSRLLRFWGILPFVLFWILHFLEKLRNHTSSLRALNAYVLFAMIIWFPAVYIMEAMNVDTEKIPFSLTHPVFRISIASTIMALLGWYFVRRWDRLHGAAYDAKREAARADERTLQLKSFESDFFPEAVINAVRSSFPSDDVPRVYSLLSRYGNATHEQERERVWLEIVTLCLGDLARLEELVDEARSDMRNILMWADKDLV
jgi:hypothetical protein